MAQPTLKSLLGKKSEITAWLQSWKEMINTSITVEDNQSNILFGTQSTINQQTFPVIYDEDILGCVKGDNNAATIAQLLSLMLKKESEKKKLGTEV